MPRWLVYDRAVFPLPPSAAARLPSGKKRQSVGAGWLASFSPSLKPPGSQTAARACLAPCRVCLAHALRGRRQPLFWLRFTFPSPFRSAMGRKEPLVRLSPLQPPPLPPLENLARLCYLMALLIGPSLQSWRIAPGDMDLQRDWGVGLVWTESKPSGDSRLEYWGRISPLLAVSVPQPSFVAMSLIVLLI